MTIQETTYTSNNTLAIEIIDNNEPYAVLTVNLPQYSFKDPRVQFVDTNNFPNAEEFIKKNNLGEPLGFYGQSGFCTYPLYYFYPNINGKEVTLC